MRPLPEILTGGLSDTGGKWRKETGPTLYARAVKQEIERLRGIDASKLDAMAAALARKRLRWYSDNRSRLDINTAVPLDEAYRVFLLKLGITEDQAPVVRRDPKRLVVHSANFCPTLEACRVLGLDTRWVCRRLTEKPTTELLRRIHPKLRFTRNYDRLRPHANVCEELILLED